MSGYFASLGKPKLRGAPKPVIAPLLGALTFRKLIIIKIKEKNYLISPATFCEQFYYRLWTELVQNHYLYLKFNVGREKDVMVDVYVGLVKLVVCVGMV